ncbi:MAG: efflux RND transporter permease subunit, partial [Chloroflexi bacterium]|nr:efflux RND transporter permease subunit [Chloroflexota bacterium]
MNPTRLAIRRPVTMAMIVVALLIMGIISFQQLPVQQLPSVSFPFVAVVVSYPGTSPNDMEQLVTLPIENAVSGVSGISQVNGLSADGVSRVAIRFAVGTDVNTAADDVSQAINRIQGRLPAGASTPQIFKANPNAAPIMNIALTGGSQEALYNTATNTLQPDLQQVPGVAAVSVNGGLVPQVNVTLKPGVLNAYGISLQQITSAIQQQNTSIPGGNTTEQGLTRTITTNAYYQNVSDLKNLVIQSRPGGLPLTLGQIASVQNGYQTINQVTNLNGKPAVVLVITAQSGANVVAVDKAVKAELARLGQQLPAGFRFAIVNDQTVYTNESIRAVENDLILAVLLPALVLL